MANTIEYGMGGERPYDLYYQHSGQTPVPSVLLAGCVGLAAGLALAYGYAYAIEYVPSHKLRLLMTALFGVALGAVTAGIAKAGKVRSVAVVLALVGVVTLAAYWFAWVVWIKAVLDRIGGPNLKFSLGQLITSPALLWDLLQLINENGTWMMSKGDKEPVRGTFLTLIWLGEALSIFGCAFGVAVPMLRDAMFCEACNRWCAKPITLRQTAVGDPKTLKESLEAHDFTYVNSLPPADPRRHWVLNYEHCPNCRQLHAISVLDRTLKMNKKGQVTANKTRKLLTRLLIDSEEAQELRFPGSKPVAQVPPPPPQ